MPLFAALEGRTGASSPLPATLVAKGGSEGVAGQGKGKNGLYNVCASACTRASGGVKLDMLSY